MIICGYKTLVTKKRCGKPATRFFRVRIIDKILYRFRCEEHKNIGFMRQHETTEISEAEAIVAQVMGT
jgi:hypothetical protein